MRLLASIPLLLETSYEGKKQKAYLLRCAWRCFLLKRTPNVVDSRYLRALAFFSPSKIILTPSYGCCTQDHFRTLSLHWIRSFRKSSRIRIRLSACSDISRSVDLETIALLIMHDSDGCDHDLKAINRRMLCWTDLVLWYCSMCKSGPHQCIFKCQRCSLISCYCSCCRVKAHL